MRCTYCYYSFRKGTTCIFREMSSELIATPILTFGLIADVQYADIEDGYDFKKVNRRYYRGALDKLKQAINSWNNDIQPKPAFLLQLGDVIDGKNKLGGAPEVGLKSLTDAFDKYSGPAYHVWGNHEYYNFTREFLLSSKLYSGTNALSCPVVGKGYYSAEPCKKVKLITLDCYEISVIGNQVGTENYEKAEKILEINPNKEKNSADGLTGMDKRFVKYNGGVTDEQLSWLDHELATAKQKKQNVIVMGHCPIYVDACCSNNLCWNGSEILQIIHCHSDAVVCYLAGHDHTGGDAVDDKGIIHITFPAVLENKEEADFGTAYLFSDVIKIIGNGRVKDFKIDLRYEIDSN